MYWYIKCLSRFICVCALIACTIFSAGCGGDKKVDIISFGACILEIRGMSEQRDYVVVASMTDEDAGDPQILVFKKDRVYNILCMLSTYISTHLVGPILGIHAVYDEYYQQTIISSEICGGSGMGAWIISLNSRGEAKTIYEDSNYGHPRLEKKGGVVSVREVWPVFRLLENKHSRDSMTQEMKDGLLVEKIFTRNKEGLFALKRTARAWGEEKELSREDRSNLEHRKQETLRLLKSGQL